jgi:hypothetical protein
MASNVTCTIDNFAATLEHILADVGHGVDEGVPVVVRKGAQKARKLTLQNAREKGWHKGVTNKRYEAGWQYKVKGQGRLVEAEIGNKATPGLPHLLEKGHAKVGGGRTTAYEHIKPAAEEAFEYTFEEMGKMIDRALR